MSEEINQDETIQAQENIIPEDTKSSEVARHSEDKAYLQPCRCSAYQN
jgi:hypothetical protein